MKRSHILLLILVSLALSACKGGKTGGEAGGRRPALRYPVEIEAVESRRVEYTVTAVGAVEAYERVQVTARVAGVVDLVKFKEGSEVKQGDTLVEIEPNRYEKAVASAKAALERSSAAKADAEAVLKRREDAIARSPGLFPLEELETLRTRVRVTTAEESLAQAALDQADLNLSDAYVRTPMTGTVDTRTVDTGQYVQPGMVLATLVRRDPLLLRFQIPEADAARIRKDMALSFEIGGGTSKHGAIITHVGSAATASRMVGVVAEIGAKDRDTLNPGAFARVTILVTAREDAPVIPQIAIRPGEKGFLAYVVEGDSARERVLRLGMRTADGKVEVLDGLVPGEKLVIRGAEALKDGAAVKVVKKGQDVPITNVP